MPSLPLPSLIERLRARSRAEAVLRRYFADHLFIEVTTPTRVLGPGTDVYIEPFRSEDHFLVTSPEFHLKRLIAAGVPRVVEFARCFRKEELGPFHQPEFTLVEWYRAGEGVEAVMTDTEQLVSQVALALSDGAVCRDERRIDVTPPFERIACQDLFRKCCGIEDVSGFAREREAEYFQLWVDRIEPELTLMERPVFVVDFPISQAALARPNPSDPTLAERFELFVLGLELCNGYGELTDAYEQRQRFVADNAVRKQKGLDELPIDEAFLNALEGGMPDCAGNALGFERLLALCLGTTLNGVVPFAAPLPG